MTRSVADWKVVHNMVSVTMSAKETERKAQGIERFLNLELKRIPNRHDADIRQMDS